jgi:cysteinyl-tRNA synthetase
MVKLIQTLVEKGYAYSSEGSVYFRVKQFKDYGKLSKIDFSEIRSGARVDSDEYEKDNARDFVLWKAAKDGEPRWETPLGPGRPGWHIECSVMSMKYLGESFDIHSGGSDLIFPHHENEIAQSEAATGKPFVRFWLHAEHLMVDGKKMSKSDGNFYTLRDLIEKGYRADEIRYLLASSHFRMPLNFTFEGLHQAQQSIQRLRNFRDRLTTEKFPAGEGEQLRTRAGAARQAFEEALDDNLNTAAALAAVFDLVREGNTAMDRGEFPEGARAAFLDVLERWDRIFAVLDDTYYDKLRRLGFTTWSATVAATGESLKSAVGTPQVESGNGDQSAVHGAGLEEEEIKKRIDDRESARRRGEYAAADEIRGELLNAGVILEDTKAGTRWKRK